MSTTALNGLRDYLADTLSPADMMWLVEELSNCLRSEEDLKPYTKEELDARIDKSEREAAEGRYRTHEEVFASILNEELREAV